MTFFLQCLADQFDRLHADSTQLVSDTSADILFAKPRELERTFAMFSIGEYVLRSSGAVEQTFGGITTKLWDDPFEWTLPEELRSPDRVLAYLNEVETTRRRGFACFASDDDLKKEVAAPGGLRSIFSLLLTTVSRAEHYQGRAFAVFQMLSDEKLPRI